MITSLKEKIDIPNSWLCGRPENEFFLSKYNSNDISELKNGDVLLIHRQQEEDNVHQIVVVSYFSCLILGRVERSKEKITFYAIDNSWEPLQITDATTQNFKVVGVVKAIIRCFE